MPAFLLYISLNPAYIFSLKTGLYGNTDLFF